MRTGQFHERYRGALAELVHAAMERAGDNLSRFLDTPAVVGDATLEISALAELADVELPPGAVAIAEELHGDLRGTLLLLTSPGLGVRVLRQLEIHDAPRDLRDSAIAELGNIVLGGFVTELADRTGLVMEPTPPVVSTDPSATIERAMLDAASDDDVVVGIAATMRPGSTTLPLGRVSMLFVPAPGTLQRIALALSPESTDVDRQEISVGMGELGVAAAPGDVLVARGLGSCVGLVLVDRIAEVAALAHVMLPATPSRRTLGGRVTYPARYGDTAVAAALEALQNAGGTRARARAYLAGGSQMFEELRGVDQLRISRRNVDAVLEALVREQVALEGSDVGGGAGRVLEVRLGPAAVRSRIPSEGRTVDLLDAS